MAKEYIAPTQSVTLNQPIIFNASTPGNNRDIYHEDETGVFILNGRNVKCNCPNAQAQYQFRFDGNIALPTGGTVGPIAVALAVDGNPIISTRAIATPAAVDEYNYVGISKIVSIPRICGCENVSIVAVSGLVDDSTGTPAPLIVLENGNLSINRIA